MPDPPAREPEAATAWARLSDAVAAAGGRLLADDAPGGEHVRAAALGYLSEFLSAGIGQCVTHADADNPSFVRMIAPDARWGLDNPDCLYLYAPVGPGRTYRIEGNRGSATAIELQVNTGHFAGGDPGEWRTISSITDDTLQCAPDGSLSVAVGPDVTGPNTLITDSPDLDPTFLLVRQYFGDWETEQPADLSISRVGAEFPTPLPDVATMTERVEQLTTWMSAGLGWWDDWMTELAKRPNDLSVFVTPGEDATAMHGLVYGVGAFACAPDEAVVLDVEVPPCRYWSVALMSPFNAALDYHGRQSHLNHTQARIDSDGVLRLVISHDDPGVWNWLDPCGFDTGGLFCRFLDPESDVPRPTFRTLARKNLDAELPADTPRVSPHERPEILERRHAAGLRRYRA